jgi:putative transposase
LYYGPEFVARNVRGWLGRIGVKTLFIEPGSLWENGYCESFNSKLRDKLLAGEQFSTLQEAKVLIEQWRRHYNAIRPHSSLGYRPPAPETILPPAAALALRCAPARPDAGQQRPDSSLMPGIALRGRPGAPVHLRPFDIHVYYAD